MNVLLGYRRVGVCAVCSGIGALRWSSLSGLWLMCFCALVDLLCFWSAGFCYNRGSYNWQYSQLWWPPQLNKYITKLLTEYLVDRWDESQSCEHRTPIFMGQTKGPSLGVGNKGKLVRSKILDIWAVSSSWMVILSYMLLILLINSRN